jgi:hypothetical protein
MNWEAWGLYLEAPPNRKWPRIIFTGWWFGTFGLVSHILGRIIPIYPLVI